MNVAKHEKLLATRGRVHSSKPNCTIEDTRPLSWKIQDDMDLKHHAPKPKVNSAAHEQYDRDAYLAILSPETRERLLSIREPK